MPKVSRTCLLTVLNRQILSLHYYLLSSIIIILPYYYYYNLYVSTGMLTWEWKRYSFGQMTIGVVNVYLTSRFFSKLSILGNTRLHQSKSSNIDHPKTCKLTKKYFFPLFLERTRRMWKNPSKMPRLTKRAIAIKEYEALVERRVKKAFIHLCFDDEDSLENDIDQLVLAELALLKSSRYCLRGAYRQWNSSWERMLEDGTSNSTEY